MADEMMDLRVDCAMAVVNDDAAGYDDASKRLWRICYETDPDGGPGKFRSFWQKGALNEVEREVASHNGLTEDEFSDKKLRIQRARGVKPTLDELRAK